jgi:hypothetical protein
MTLIYPVDHVKQGFTRLWHWISDAAKPLYRWVFLRDLISISRKHGQFESTPTQSIHFIRLIT